MNGEINRSECLHWRNLGFFPSLEKKSPRSVQSLRLAIPKCYVKSYIKLKTKIKIYFILKPVKLVLIGNCMKRL